MLLLGNKYCINAIDSLGTLSISEKEPNGAGYKENAGSPELMFQLSIHLGSDNFINHSFTVAVKASAAKTF